jgi:hypothetical protein
MIAAVRLSNTPYGQTVGPDLIALASEILPFLIGSGTVKLVTTVKVERKNWDDWSLTTEGVTVNVSLTVDDQSVVITVLPEDDQGNVTPDTLTWSSDDPGDALAAATTSADTHTWTGVVQKKEGTINLTVSDSANPSLPSTVIVLTLGAGETSQLVADAVVTHADGTTTDVSGAPPASAAPDSSATPSS